MHAIRILRRIIRRTCLQVHHNRFNAAKYHMLPFQERTARSWNQGK